MAADSNAIYKALADMPRRDNTAYHRAVNEARWAYQEAERRFAGTPIEVSSEMMDAAEGNSWVLTLTFRPISAG
jgi:hypothetical protein